MDSNNEKKGKRPRIGEIRVTATEGNNEQSTYASSNYNDSERPARPYQQGYRQGGYNNNRQGGYNRYNSQSGYNRYNSNRYNQFGDNNNYRPNNSYQPTAPVEGAPASTDSENDAQHNSENRPYQQRQYQQGYRQGGYNNRQGGYNRYNNQGGYDNHQGGYNNRQGGYNNNRQGGYNNHQNGYNNPQGGYNNRQGGYNNNRQGGYNNRQGGYNNNNRQGGYNNNRQGGYNNHQGGYNNNNNRQRKPMRQNQFGMPQGGKSFIPRPKRIEYEMPIPDPNEQIRLNKFMANAGICSRREADDYILKGLVKVNGEVVTELGTKISHNDTVEYEDKVVTLESKCYVLLNKPKDCVTTSDDPNGRLTVMDLVKNACEERIYPVGRLDRNTTGVLLLTNDGDLASKLTHPKYVKKKIYHVWTDKDISEDDMQRIADGIELEDGPIHADAISYATETDRNQAGIEIHSGRNRIVRRIFEKLGYHVTKLDRVYFAGLTKKNLPRGRWRYLTQEEVNFLKMGSFE